MKSTKMMLIATAAMGGLLAGSTTHAAVATSTSHDSQSITKKVVASAKAGVNARTLDDKHSCKGMNDCKGMGGCKTGDNGCKGKNSCKGKGGCKSAAL